MIILKNKTKTKRFFVVFSPIQTVIVSQGDVSDFHHIQGVVSDLIAVWIQDACVFLSPPPWKSPAELPTVFRQTQGRVVI